MLYGLAEPGMQYIESLFPNYYPTYDPEDDENLKKRETHPVLTIDYYNSVIEESIHEIHFKKIPRTRLTQLNAIREDVFSYVEGYKFFFDKLFLDEYFAVGERISKFNVKEIYLETQQKKDTSLYHVWDEEQAILISPYDTIIISGLFRKRGSKLGIEMIANFLAVGSLTQQIFTTLYLLVKIS